MAEMKQGIPGSRLTTDQKKIIDEAFKQERDLVWSDSFVRGNLDVSVYAACEAVVLPLIDKIASLESRLREAEATIDTMLRHVGKAIRLTYLDLVNTRSQLTTERQKVKYENEVQRAAIHERNSDNEKLTADLAAERQRAERAERIIEVLRTTHWGWVEAAEQAELQKETKC